MRLVVQVFLVNIPISFFLLTFDVVVGVLYIRLVAFLSSMDDVMGPYVNPTRVPPAKINCCALFLPASKDNSFVRYSIRSLI